MKTVQRIRNSTFSEERDELITRPSLPLRRRRRAVLLDLCALVGAAAGRVPPARPAFPHRTHRAGFLGNTAHPSSTRPAPHRLPFPVVAATADGRRNHPVAGLECVEVEVSLFEGAAASDPRAPAPLPVTVLEATAASQEILVDMALEEDGGGGDDGAVGLRQGDPTGAVLWPASRTVAEYLLADRREGRRRAAPLPPRAGRGVGPGVDRVRGVRDVRADRCDGLRARRARDGGVRARTSQRGARRRCGGRRGVR